MKALLVDDTPATLTALAELIEVEGDLACCRYVDPLAALAAASEQQFAIAVIDHRMPTLNGIALTRRLRATPGYAQVPIVMMTTRATKKVRIDALQAGVTELLPKSPDATEVRIRLRNMITMAIALRQPSELVLGLKREVEAAARALLKREEEMILRLAYVLKYRDSDTGSHTIRVARYSRILAEELGLPQPTCHAISLAAPLHDVGKVAIPDAILLKQGPLDPGEVAIVKNHAAIGAEILGGSGCGLIQLAAEIANSHHERWDGKGYPRGLKGHHIPFAARIVTIADVFDALTSIRPYKAAISPEEAFVHIARGRGTQFDPAGVDAFLAAKAKILEAGAETRVTRTQPPR
jgi:putative two-component system response regulator